MMQTSWYDILSFGKEEDNNPTSLRVNRNKVFVTFYLHVVRCCSHSIPHGKHTYSG